MKKIVKLQVRVALHHVKEVLEYEEDKVGRLERMIAEDPERMKNTAKILPLNRIRVCHLKTAVDALTKLLE